MAQSGAEFSDRNYLRGPPMRLDGVTVIGFSVNPNRITSRAEMIHRGLDHHPDHLISILGSRNAERVISMVLVRPRGSILKAIGETIVIYGTIFPEHGGIRMPVGLDYF